MIGVTHGIGGSAAVAVLLLASIPDQAWAAVALVVFAGGTALSMSALSAVWGWLLGTNALRARFRAAVVPLAVFGMLFGIAYGIAAWAPGVPLV